MKKVLSLLFVVLSAIGIANAQTPDSLNFFPAHAGDVRQYRSAFTGDITMTQYFDKDSTDQYGNKYVWQRGSDGIYKIDALNNVYGQSSPTDTIDRVLLYKLDADTGTVWTYMKTPWDSILFKVVGIFPGSVFGKPVTVKKIEETRYAQPEIGPFWMGNRYLATGFGFVQWDIEPSDVYVLSAAIINGVHYGTVVSVTNESAFPKTYDVLTNYPNPFNPSTVVSYQLSVNNYVTLKIIDLLGREIATLVNEAKQAGSYTVRWNAQGMPSGVYFAVMQTKSKIITHKLLLTK